MTTTRPLQLTIDCHDHAYEDDGPLVGFAERYGILIERLPATSWAWWYRIIGPRDHLVRFLTEEYCEDAVFAGEMVDTAIPWSRSAGVRGGAGSWRLR